MAKKPRRAKSRKKTVTKIEMRRLWFVALIHEYRDPTSGEDDAKNAKWNQHVAARTALTAIDAAKRSAYRQAIEADPDQTISPEDFFVVAVYSLGAFDSDALED